MKKMMILICMFSLNVQASENDFSIRELFGLPEIVNSESFEYRSKRELREGERVTIDGQRVVIRKRFPHSRRRIGQCIIVKKVYYSDGKHKYRYFKPCR